MLEADPDKNKRDEREALSRVKREAERLRALLELQKLRAAKNLENGKAAERPERRLRVVDARTWGAPRRSEEPPKLPPTDSFPPAA